MSVTVQWGEGTSTTGTKSAAGGSVGWTTKTFLAGKYVGSLEDVHT